MSKKDKSDILSGMGSGFQIIKALRDAGASDDQLRAIIANGSLLPQQIVALLRGSVEIKTSDTYSVTVDYTCTLAEMIQAGNYGWVNDSITEKNFPIQRPSVSGDAWEEVRGSSYRTPGIQNSIKLVLVHLNKGGATTQQVLEHMGQFGLRPARIEELLALGEKYSDLQRQFPLIALGSSWVDLSRYRNVPCLYGRGSGRGLDLRWGDSGSTWGGYYRFVGVSK